MVCPACGSENCNVQMIQQNATTKKKGKGLGDYVNNAARDVVGVATLGVSNLFWRKSYGKNKTSFSIIKVGICQSCGNSWEV